MTREEIIAIAGEPVGYNYIGHFGFRPGLHPDEKALYTADQLVAAVLAEREECAKLLDEMAEEAEQEMEPSGVIAYYRSKAAAIRARGNHV